MLSLSQLMILTQTDQRKWKNDYRLEFFKSGADLGTEGAFLAFVAIIVGGKEPRKPSIKLFSDTIEATSPAKVSCTCPYFRIKLAIPLTTSGSTDMRVRASDLPTKYRGVQKPGLCPHLMKLAEVILSSDNTELDRVRSSSKDTNVSDKLKRLT